MQIEVFMNKKSKTDKNITEDSGSSLKFDISKDDILIWLLALFCENGVKSEIVGENSCLIYPEESSFKITVEKLY